MSIGSTTEDIDGIPKDMERRLAEKRAKQAQIEQDILEGKVVDRGPPEEDWKSPAELRGEMRLVAEAKQTMGEQISMRGLLEEMKMMQFQMDQLMENNNRCVNLISTLQNQFAQFERLRAIELHAKVAGGSTTPEDIEDGSNT